jgi:hypothetical protein
MTNVRAQLFQKLQPKIFITLSTVGNSFGISSSDAVLRLVHTCLNFIIWLYIDLRKTYSLAYKQ